MRTPRLVRNVLAVVLLSASTAAPQSDIVLSRLGVDLWPDYDRSGVLVIYRATIAPGIPLPTRIVLRIPARAGLPSAVAERLEAGELITLPYERTVDGETALIELTPNRPIVQLEYYDPDITREEDRRRFAFRWPGDFEVRDFRISLQQPHLAQNFTTIPEAIVGAQSVDGLMYHTLSRTGVKKGETLGIQVSYEKASDQLSVETMAPVAAPTPTPVAGNAPASDNRTVLIVLVALFAGAGATIAGVMARTRRQGGLAPRSTPPPRSGRSSSSGPKATRFCTQCGAGVGGGDRFCKRCGAALKP